MELMEPLTLRWRVTNHQSETMMRITTNDILDALIKEPTLAYGGFHRTPAEARSTRGDLVTHLDEIQLCYDWLQMQEIGKKATDRSPSSYGLKHAVEFAAGEYVSNGTFIVACIIRGVPYKRYGHSHPNAACAVKRRRCNRRLHGAKANRAPYYAEFMPLRVDSPPTDRTESTTETRQRRKWQ